MSIFTNVDAGCQPPRKKESVFLCNNLSRLNKSEFILFTFVFKTNSISDHTHTSEREILLVSMQDKVIKVNHRLPLSWRAASGAFHRLMCIIKFLITGSWMTAAASGAFHKLMCIIKFLIAGSWSTAAASMLLPKYIL